MVDKKSSGKPLMITLMVIFLCLASVTGATYALFTSDPNDGTIGINATAGDLRVDIVAAEEGGPSLVGSVLDFVVDGAVGEILFEPGATYYTRGFRVKNTGNIPMNFILYISDDSALSPEFYNAFEVWLTTDPSARDGMVRLQEFEGKLDPEKASEPFYLVFRMKTTAGNEFQDCTFSGVGVTVCAVQGNAYTD